MARLQLEHLAKAVSMARTRFIYGLDKTPDDRLAWSPGGGAMTPLQLAGKIAGFGMFLGHLFQEGTPPDRSGGPPAPPADREQAKAAVDAALRRLETAIRGLSEADLERTVQAPWGANVSVAEAVWWVPGVLGYAQGQLNYVQTSYGDMDPNIPPDWKQGGS